MSAVSGSRRRRRAAGSRAGRASAAVAAARAGVLVVALAQAEIGVWGEVSPRGFYDTYPGAGHHWLTALGPFNGHLLRDFASAELGLAVLLACAAVWFERRLMLVAGTSFLAATLPHFVYHLTTTGAFAAQDDVASLAGFAAELVLVVFAMVTAVRRQAPGTGARTPERSS